MRSVEWKKFGGKISKKGRSVSENASPLKLYCKLISVIIIGANYRDDEDDDQIKEDRSSQSGSVTYPLKLFDFLIKFQIFPLAV